VNREDIMKSVVVENNRLAEMTEKGKQLETVICDLEKKIEVVIEKNNKMVKSYAEVLKTKQDGESTGIDRSTVTVLQPESTNIELLAEYSEREKKKNNVVIHNLPESKKESAEERMNEDMEAVGKMVLEGLNMKEMEFTTVRRINVRNQDKDKNRMIVATLATPARKRAMLAAAKTLRNEERWSRVFISPDRTYSERQEFRKMREDLKRRREGGEESIGIRNNRIVKTRTETDTDQTSVKQN